MRSSPRRRLERLIRSFEPGLNGSFALLGRSYSAQTEGPWVHVPTAPRTRPLLGSVIYRRAHCRDDSTGAPRAIGGRHDVGTFLDALSRANHGKGCWQAGWVVERVERERLFVRRHGLRFTVHPQRAQYEGDGPSEGDEVRVFVAKEYRDLMSGFYAVLGDLDPSTQFPRRRIYWNLQASAAVEFTHRLSEVLNRENVPFHMKLLSHPAAYRRSDSAVIYLPEAAFERTMELLWPVHSALRSRLNPRTSIFSRRLAPGLSVGDDPPSGESFGVLRSRVVADAIDEVGPRSGSRADFVDGVMSLLARRGIDPDEPWRVEADALVDRGV